MPLTEEEMLGLYEELTEELNALGDKGFTDLLETRGITPGVILKMAWNVAFSFNENVNIQQWTLAFSMGYILGNSAALKEMGKAVFE